VTLTSGKLATF